MRRMRGGKKNTALCVVLCSKGVAYIGDVKSVGLLDVSDYPTLL